MSVVVATKHWMERLRVHFPPAVLGRVAEARALLFYRLRGFRLVQKNVRTNDGEIDLVVRRGRLIAFVEVKCRQQRERGAPYEAIDREKQLRIMRVAERVVLRGARDRYRFRFDVISIYWTGFRFQIAFYPAAFELASDPSRPWLHV